MQGCTNSLEKAVTRTLVEGTEGGHRLCHVTTAAVSPVKGSDLHSNQSYRTGTGGTSNTHTSGLVSNSPDGARHKAQDWFFKEMELIVSQVPLNVLRGDHTTGGVLRFEFMYIDGNLRKWKNKCLSMIPAETKMLVKRRKASSGHADPVASTACILTITETLNSNQMKT